MLSAIVAASISFAYQAIVPSAQTLVVHETFSPSEKTINVAKSCGTGYSCAKAGGCQCACPFKAETPERRSRPASMMAATIISDEAARVAAQAVVAATSAEAEKWCVKGGNGGDFFGSEGIQPVVEAALAAAGSSEAVFDAVEAAATAAAGRTNANAARVPTRSSLRPASSSARTVHCGATRSPTLRSIRHFTPSLKYHSSPWAWCERSRRHGNRRSQAQPCGRNRECIDRTSDR